MPGTWLAAPFNAEYGHPGHDQDEQNNQEFRAPMLQCVGHSVASSEMY
jgi:hypothetical protein